MATHLPSPLQPFRSDGDGEVQCGVTPNRPQYGECVFDSTLTWRVHEADNGGIAICMHAGAEKRLFQVLALNDDFTRGQVFLDETQMHTAGPHFALEEPLFQIWTNFLLLKSRGLLVHALGVEIDGAAHLFMGTSGVGKSTFAHVFANAGIGTILSDDRIIIRADGDSYRAYGTPWNGEPQFMAAASAPIAAIYFLAQAPSCIIEPVSGSAAVSQLFANCFLAGWPREPALQFALDNAAAVAGMIPCYDFGFTPDERSLNALGFLTE
ncbi:MAG: hypothetical protein JXX29_21350 [Deltaproteobacteria bacterium]|nr:hypothetical protein [Deltaproteobacteria bacterium]MBN2674243.1 hypothetical protein [Deltaproteobacteria bacterium]